MNVNEALKLINNKKTTIDDVYKFIFKDVEKFQNEREAFYMQEIKEKYTGLDTDLIEESLEGAATKIAANIERDTKVYVNIYANNSIDALLDAYNNKLIKDKNSVMNFITLLTQLKETYSKSTTE
jgi:hypothetical protein